jgi:hypothetical protein
MDDHAKASVVKSVVLAVVLVVGVSGCGTAGAVDLGAASGHVPVAKYPATPIAGLPPVGARPSTPPTGACLITGHVSEPVDYDLYADGRLILQKWTPAGAPLIIPKGANALTTGYVQQRLTPRGARLLRSRIVATGHLQPGYLPAWAWADQTIRPYIASHYVLSHDRSGPDPALLPPPVAAALGTGIAHHGSQVITLNHAIALAHAVLKAGIPSDHDGPWVEFGFGDLTPGTRGVEMEPILPGMFKQPC